ncbi:uncharacterized protein [Drosophila takahashii]|uniref:uncharacterized protein n=1 Tax=Drosophila takahashii TaxID=29030 RepID=UPI0038990B1C
MLPVLKAKYGYCYSAYERCGAQIADQIAQTPQNPQATSTPDTSQTYIPSGCHLPPCDTEVFTGDYLRWPTFRDLFTAIYINNPRLTPVEKLFHLNAKTRGGAHNIVANSPLTNDGFRSAWDNLTERFENKRLLVNSQLKILFNVPSVTQESGSALKELQSTIQGCLTALEMSGIQVETWDCLLVYMCSSKLPKLTLSLWEQSLHNKAEIPTWHELNVFLTERHRTLEAIDDVRPSGSSQAQPRASTSNSASRRINSYETRVTPRQPRGCDLCNGENHPIRTCAQFLRMTVDQRIAYIKRKQLCLNCFARTHQLRDCESAHNCFTCRGRHHTLLHRGTPSPARANPTPTPRSRPNTPGPSAASGTQPTLQNYFAAGSRSVLLGTAMISICHQGSNYQARALIDSGSEATFITERLFNLIKLPFQVIQAQVSGLNQTVSAETKKLCQLTIRSPTRPSLQLNTTAYVLPQIAGNLPSCPLPQHFLRDLPELPLADPKFYESAQIDLLIGADILPSILLSGTRANICGSLLGQETIFGWILTGPVPAPRQDRISSFSTHVAHTYEASLDKLLTKFWEVEDLPVKVAKESDVICEDNFLRTTTKDDTGRYVVSLPFRDPENMKWSLGHSRSLALAQFLRNEQRLKRDSTLKSKYDSVIQEYLDLNHMREVPPTHDSACYYLPHHAVLKPESTTTKLRVVFNASSPSDNGVSLNDILHAGPVLQSDLTIQILKWRYFRFVYSADIEKMYRQIWVDPKQTAFQRILFRNREGYIRDFELKTVTFGVNCAPFLAIRVLQQLATDVQLTHPRASKVIRGCMYVDDVLSGADSAEEAHLTIRELQSALDSAGFPLRKWTSNHKEVLAHIETNHLLNAEFLEIDTESTAKTLGVRWKATSDEFFFAPPDLSNEATLTKRHVLSQIAKLFDPAGWLAPFVVCAKIFMQEIWLHDLGWDDELPIELCQKWRDFLKSYSVLDQVRIPRWVSFRPEFRVEHHGFCDASQKAYGAAIYVRVEIGHTTLVHLLTAKTRVAPVKTVSLPRLELCGALLLSEMAESILPHMPVLSSKLHCWTDSTIVLAWLAKPACQWTTFVANRVTKITQSTEAANWAHVRSEHNPADLASRGVPLQDLIDNSLWWHGPTWLSKPRDQWPSQSTDLQVTEVERRPVKAHVASIPTEDILDRFSKLDRALRVLAYVHRFVQRCKKQSQMSEVRLEAQELVAAERLMVISTQRRYFSNEYRCLSQKRPVSATSSILSLNPFLDQKGLIRACGRITASENLRYDERHPIILPYECALSRLLVNFTHLITLHGGNQLVVRLTRSRYWIPRIKNLVKAVINSCKVCVIHKKRLQIQMMGSFPKERVSFSRPFTYTGMDYAGPFDIKNYKGRACLITKGYVLVFVCFSTKAIHLEPTSDLTTEKFLAAFARFVSRRGCPRQVQSDNGKTFVGAATLLSRDFLQAVKESVTDAYSHQQLNWQFIPPGAPHMGGLWEAGVKSFKTLFYKSTATRKYTFEELSTLLAKIEACLNSRPLSPMSEDPTDLLALTPGHFLVGGPLLSIVEPELKGESKSIVNRWQHLKALHQQFQARWKEEYLKELHKRNKWQAPTANLRVGDLVALAPAKSANSQSACLSAALSLLDTGTVTGVHPPAAQCQRPADGHGNPGDRAQEVRHSRPHRPVYADKLHRRIPGYCVPLADYHRRRRADLYGDDSVEARRRLQVGGGSEGGAKRPHPHPHPPLPMLALPSLGMPTSRLSRSPAFPRPGSLHSALKHSAH